MSSPHAGPAPPTGPPEERAHAPVTATRADPSSRNRPLVVVSNRLPFTAERGPGGIGVRRSPGGLVAALEPVLTQHGGVWVGWTGVTQEGSNAAGAVAVPASGPVTYRAVSLTAHEVSLYYAGFANGTLWPLFHYFVGRTRIDGNSWRVYERVNERFARAAAEASTDDALVWVHDYQLLRVPYYLRQRAPRRRIALFLHIPFPAADVLRVLPWSRALMRGMLASDLVGVHIPSYAEHFLTGAERLLGCEVDRASGLVRFEGREVSVQAHPISIDVGLIERLAHDAGPPRTRGPQRPAEILGVDRLDYTKGIRERLLAVERLLERYPVYRGRVTFTQVLVPSRERVAEYSALKRELDETVGRINGRFSEPEWSPIRYLVRSLPPAELVARYREADVALVTPLRDGMNLVAKEYVASQLENDGVLILSEMAGAADELQEAVLVNPFDTEDVAAALHRALSMPEDERRARMSALRHRVRAHDVQTWVARFLDAAEHASEQAHATVAPPAEVARRALAPWLAQRSTVALFLDYDGTLTPIVPRPEDARLSDAARQTLDQAARTPNLDTVIVSGRSLADIQPLVGVPGLTYVGNHGFEIEGPGISYRHEGFAAAQGALTAAAHDLAALAVAGARVEHKGATLAYHTCNVPPNDRERVERAAATILRRHRLNVVPGKAIVEGRPPVRWDKGRAVLYVLVRRHGADWPSRVRALYIGDDVTDQDAFRSLQGIGRSICVEHPAGGGSGADYTLPDPEAVMQLLRWLASGAFTAAKP
ncbi:MAG: bifunctional alpha,alpha-trehalose-phosphate synthase (UDP-forming)/trehalose-phosphatase [Gemmatimonadales bacterium]